MVPLWYLSCWGSMSESLAAGDTACTESERQSGPWVLILHVCVFLPSRFPCPVTYNISPSSLRNYFHHKVECLFCIKFFPQSLVVSCSCFKDSFSLTLLLFYHLCPEWPADSNGCRSKDGKECQQFWNYNTDILGKLEIVILPN